jgi:hypothetical protein
VFRLGYMARLRKHLSYANVMSTLAVLLVLSGATAYAASKIGSSQLKAGAVTSGKIRKNAVTAGKIREGAVIGSKLRDGAVTGEKIAPGAVGLGQLSPEALPTPVASMEVNGNGEVLSATPGVRVMRVRAGAYCVGLPFKASGGAASTRGDSSRGSTAQVTVPADSNCSEQPSYQSATVYTIDPGTSATEPKLANENWGAVFR